MCHAKYCKFRKMEQILYIFKLQIIYITCTKKQQNENNPWVTFCLMVKTHLILNEAFMMGGKSLYNCEGKIMAIMTIAQS